MKNKKVLITGGAGFLGTHLTEYLFGKGEYEIVILDKLEESLSSKYKDLITHFQGDIMSKHDVSKVFKDHGPFPIIFHLASAMPNKAVTNNVLWETNVLGTRNMIEEAVKNKTDSFVFTSSNVAYGIPKVLPVTERTSLHPLEIYGRSKEQAEKELENFKENINIQIFRCPVITGTGRLGLQAILYEFISENKNVYVLGNGSNKYQFIDAMDACIALEKASNSKGFP